ncbi:unnamed protein product [Ixodes pacificus]
MPGCVAVTLVCNIQCFATTALSRDNPSKIESKSGENEEYANFQCAIKKELKKNLF